MKNTLGPLALFLGCMLGCEAHFTASTGQQPPLNTPAGPSQPASPPAAPTLRPAPLPSAQAAPLPTPSLQAPPLQPATPAPEAAPH